MQLKPNRFSHNFLECTLYKDQTRYSRQQNLYLWPCFERVRAESGAVVNQSPSKIESNALLHLTFLIFCYIFLYLYTEEALQGVLRLPSENTNFERLVDSRGIPPGRPYESHNWHTGPLSLPLSSLVLTHTSLIISQEAHDGCGFNWLILGFLVPI